MAKTFASSSKTSLTGFKVGRRAFEKISAVEGIRLSAEMVRDFDEFDRKGLSANARRRAIVRKYGAAQP